MLGFDVASDSNNEEQNEQNDNDDELVSFKL